MITNINYHIKQKLFVVFNDMYESINKFYNKLLKNKYVVDFLIQLINCEPFTIIYSEIDKFCKQLFKQDLISGYMIKYK